jgi:CheY-like chemotaxis protein
MKKEPTSKENTLRMAPHELNKLLEQFDHTQPKTKHPDREFVRWTYRVSSVDLILENSSGSKISLPVATRNISRGGISVLHSSYIHTGCPCEIVLQIPDGKPQTIPGRIIRCAHATGRVHEIGIAFDEQISTKDLLGLDPLNEAYSLEGVHPDHLHGSILVVTPTELDRDIIFVFLNDTDLVLLSADTTQAAVEKAKNGCDLVIADYHLGDESGADLVKALRDAGADMPIIIMTTDKSETVLDTIRDADASGILSKPVSAERLLQALAEFLHADGDGGPLYSTLTKDDAAYPLLSKFLTNIPSMALGLENALRENDEKICINTCRAFIGAASPLGFDPISLLAAEAEKQLLKSGLKNASTNIRALIVACRRIKAKQAA